jgi:hypothetical protein
MNIGFSAPTTHFNTSIPGQEGFYCRVIMRASSEFPYRANVRTPTAYARFLNEDHAKAFLRHPGCLPLMAKEYLEAVALIKGENNDLC